MTEQKGAASPRNVRRREGVSIRWDITPLRGEGRISLTRRTVVVVDFPDMDAVEQERWVLFFAVRSS